VLKKSLVLRAYLSSRRTGVSGSAGISAVLFHFVCVRVRVLKEVLLFRV
jgi:hypothetical protein